jgi:heparosan-N-sulfate-glucuronate 5-epimerase
MTKQEPLINNVNKDTLKLAIIFSISLILYNCAGDAFKTASSSDDSKQESQILLDRFGVALVKYGYIGENYIGLQRNPTTISTTATDYYSKYKSNGNETAREIFLNNTNWLVDNAVPHGSYSILEYDFPWHYELKPPWRSAMAQALAMQALIRAHEETGYEKYLESAKMLLNSFFVEVEDGGVTYKTSNDGWWYEEYAADTSTEPRVLNGMMFTLLGLYDYIEYTNESSAKYLFDQGVIALRNNLPSYDNSKYSYSYYDVHKTTNPLSYHIIQVELLGKLYNITKEEILKVYHDRWMNCNPDAILE